jgi:uncharacterized RDD family membrane protein YckC
MTPTLLVLGVIALLQLLEFSFRSTASHSIFRLAVVNAKGQRANRARLLLRWSIVWLPLFVPMSFVGFLAQRSEGLAFICAVILLGLWLSAALYAVLHPTRGLHDSLARTWVVRC